MRLDLSWRLWQLAVIGGCLCHTRDGVDSLDRGARRAGRGRQLQRLQACSAKVRGAGQRVKRWERMCR